MIGLAVALLVGAASPEPITVALPAFDVVAVPDSEVVYYRALLANHLRVQGVRVLEAPEAPDAVLHGTFTRVAAVGMWVDLRVERADTGKALAAVSMTAQNPKEVGDILQRAAQEISAELFTALGRAPVPQKVEPLPEAPAAPVGSKLQPGVGMGIAVGVLGAGGAIAGGVLLIMARNQLSAVARGTPSSYFAAQQQASAARSQALISTVVLATGGVLFAAGVLYALYSAKVNTFFTISASLAPGQGGFVVSGVLP